MVALRYIAVLMLLLCYPSVALAAATDFCETWDTTAVGNLTTGASSATCTGNSNWLCHYPDIPSNLPQRIRIVTSPVRSGPRALMLENNPGETWLLPYSRTDLQSLHGSVSSTDRWEGWLSVSLYDDSTAFDDAFVVQMHHNGPSSPPLMPLRYYTGGGLRTLHYYGTVEIGYPGVTGPRTYCDSGCTVTAALGTWTDFKGKWRDLVWHIKYDPDTPLTGSYEMWIDGVQKFSQIGNVGVGYADDVWNYLVLSIYRATTGATAMKIYNDEIRRRTSADGGSYASVCPTIHAKAPAITAPTSGQSGVSITPTITATFSKGYADAARLHITDVQGVFAHHYTDWKITTDEAGANIVTSSLKDSTNLLSWTSSALSLGTTYYVHVRHWVRAGSAPGLDRNYDGAVNDSDRYEGPWSTVQFTTLNPPGGGEGYFSLDPGGTGEITLDPTGTGEVTLTN